LTTNVQVVPNVPKFVRLMPFHTRLTKFIILIQKNVCCAVCVLMSVVLGRLRKWR